MKKHALFGCFNRLWSLSTCYNFSLPVRSCQIQLNTSAFECLIKRGQNSYYCQRRNKPQGKSQSTSFCASRSSKTEPIETQEWFGGPCSNCSATELSTERCKCFEEEDGNAARGIGAAIACGDRWNGEGALLLRKKTWEYSQYSFLIFWWFFLCEKKFSNSNGWFFQGSNVTSICKSFF